MLLGHVILDGIEPHVEVAIEDDALNSAVGAVLFVSQDAVYVICEVASGNMIFAGNPEIQELKNRRLSLSSEI